MAGCHPHLFPLTTPGLNASSALFAAQFKRTMEAHAEESPISAWSIWLFQKHSGLRTHSGRLAEAGFLIAAIRRSQALFVNTAVIDEARQETAGVLRELNGSRKGAPENHRRVGCLVEPWRMRRSSAVSESRRCSPGFRDYPKLPAFAAN